MTSPSTPFPYRANSLNLFRLVLALLVLVAHGFFTFGEGWSPGFNGENIGGWAVAGFFVISGFLITRSRFRTEPGAFLLHRIARIFPAFLVCLLLTGFVLAPFAALVQGQSLLGTLTTPVTPFEYVWGNITLYIRHYGIGETLSALPYPDVWNGSLWTLYFEFLCYVTVWVLGFLAIYRRSALFVGLVWLASVAVRLLTVTGTTAGLDGDFELFAKLLPFFLGGSLVYLLVERWGMRRWWGIGSIVVSAVMVVFVPGIGGQLGAPAIAYALLFLSTVIPQPAWIARNDVSYGFYIYAWPVQQLVLLLGGGAWGLLPYILLTVVFTFGAGWLSWIAIERPAMRAVRGRPGAAAPSAPGTGAA